MIRYHDTEWGRPVFTEEKLFECLTLEGAQAGLSWLTILRKRNGYREAFADFNPQRVAVFDTKQLERLVQNPAIVRHRGKIESTINNARRILALWNAGQTLAELCWSFTGGKPMQNHWQDMSELPSSTSISAELSRSLKKQGFRFVGETTCYSFMQATGMVNDHVRRCPQHAICHSLADSSTLTRKEPALNMKSSGDTPSRN
jgi:DNA-3-methyladenine glycosylase I